MLAQIVTYINNLNYDFDKLYNLEQLDILFERLVDKFSNNNENNINSIKFIMIDKFNYNPLTRIENIKKLCEERDGQNKFREELIMRDEKCLITGDNSEICEACHIIPYCDSKSFDIANGLLLNRCFHKLFDTYKISINSNNYLEFDENVQNEIGYNNYLIYNEKQININYDCREYLDIHYQKFLETIKINRILA